jgi:glycosyltransferase involved in cell wall biosynthesis
VPPPPTGARDRALVRAGFETPLTATVIVQASRMEAGKGHAVHLEALGRLRDSPDWVCWVVGGAQSRAEERYAERLRLDAARLGIADRVRFVGQRADVPRLLAAADVHCQPNVRPDSFGVAFVEALYAGLPVVTSALGGALEIVDASCGVLLPPGDAGALAASLRTLIDDPPRRRALGAAGPSRARSLCDPGQQVRRLAEALAGVAGAAVS